MSRVVQPSIAKRITFATWARKEGINRHSSATWTVPDGTDIPEALLVGAQVDGKPYAVEEKPKRTRTRKTKDRGPVEEPAPPLVQTDRGHVFNPVDYPDKNAEPENTQED